jgi:hypothetical protein
MLFDITEDDDAQVHYVRIEETHVGKGVFAARPYPKTAIIGEIKGNIVHESESTTEYTFDFENGLQLEPFAPFRYVNHSCEPNCEFVILDHPVAGSNEDRRALFLVAIENIFEGDEFSISYNWPASCAIECHCGSNNCVGWIVCETELDQIMDHQDDDEEGESEFDIDFEEEYEFHEIGYYFPD